MQKNIEQKSTFWRTAIFSYLIFLLAYVAFVIIRANMNLYPNFSLDALAALAAGFCLFSIPWWLVAALIWLFKNKKHWALKAGAVTLLIIGLIVGGSMGSMLMAFNLASDTQNIANYLKFDKGVAMNAQAEALFPKEIPLDAQKPAYYYSYSNMMGNFVLIQAEWTLEGERFTEEVERARALLQDAKEEAGEENAVVLSVNDEVYFAYYEETGVVRYMYSGQ